MKYAGIIKNDTAAGEGVCVSFYTQGCPFHCKGCHNPQTWDFNGGKEFTQDTVTEIIQAIKAEGAEFTILSVVVFSRTIDISEVELFATLGNELSFIPNSGWISVSRANFTAYGDFRSSGGWKNDKSFDILSNQVEVGSGVVVYIHTNNIFFTVFNFGLIGPVVARSTTSVLGSANEIALVTDFLIVVGDGVKDYMVSRLSHRVSSTRWTPCIGHECTSTSEGSDGCDADTSFHDFLHRVKFLS